MVSPVYGASAQQVTIANPYQQDGNKQTQEIKSREQETNRAQTTTNTNETQNNPAQKSQRVQVASAAESKPQQNAGSGQERGSLLDISV